MSDIATTTFVGVLVAVLMAIKYWKLMLAVLAALLLTAVIMGVRQLTMTMEHPAPAPLQSQLSSDRR